MILVNLPLAFSISFVGLSLYYSCNEAFYLLFAEGAIFIHDVIVRGDQISNYAVRLYFLYEVKDDD